MKLDGDPQWLVSFKGRHWSGPTEQNFLWKQGNVYIMDNHRAAMWCWLRELGPRQKVNIFHIDEHYDSLYSQFDKWLGALPEDLASLSITEYLEQAYKTEVGDFLPIVRWDNYLSLFLDIYKSQVAALHCATHGVGDRPRWTGMLPSASDRLPKNIETILEEREGHGWIVNVDLDYFFCEQGGGRKLMFSDGYVETIFRVIRQCYEQGKVTCLTLCLTPDEHYTGGWAQAEALCDRICRILGIAFKLPPRPDRLSESRPSEM